jgi:hypothetical protein
MRTQIFGRHCLVGYCFLAVICLARCTPVKVPGIYRSKPGWYMLAINSDSTFTYNYGFQFVHEHSYGLFKIVNNRSIMLCSSIRDKRIPMTIKAIDGDQATADNFIKFKFDFDKDESQYYKCQLNINGEFFESKHCDSLSSIRLEKPLDSFSLGITSDDRVPGRFIDTLYTGVFTTEVRSGNNLSVEVLVYDSLFNYKVFDDELIKASNRKVEVFSNGQHIFLFRRDR